MGVSTRDLNAFWKIAEIDTIGVLVKYISLPKVSWSTIPHVHVLW